MPGAFFPNVRQSPEEVSRVLRNVHYYKLMGRPELALKELEQACQQNPDNLKLVNTLAQSYEELGQFESARKIYREALARHGSHPALANNLCFTYYLEGRWQEAETCYRQTLARDPGNEAARNNLGLLYCRLGRQDEARRLWQDVEGQAAAEYKTRQAMAVLGTADRAVYALAPQPAPTSQESLTPTPVAAVPPPQPSSSQEHKTAAGLSPQKVALQLVTRPGADNPVTNESNPLDEAQAQPTSAKTSSSPVTPPDPKISDHTGYSRQPQPGLPPATAPPPVAAVPRPPAVSGDLDFEAASSAPPKVTTLLANKTEPEKPSSHNIKAINEGRERPDSPNAAAAPRTNHHLRPAPLTAAELVNTAIEVRNGTPAPNLARQMRSLLELEGFTVAQIGNHVDFGAEKTMIYYQPEAQRVAKAVQTAMLPMAGLEQTAAINGARAIKVLLGHDLLENQELLARLRENKAKSRNAVTATPLAIKSIAQAKENKPDCDEPDLQAACREISPAAPLSQPPARVPEAQTVPQNVVTPLTAADLMGATIEVRNGTPTPNLARRMRSLLKQEGFKVTRIGNHINFGTETTIIFYRPEAERVARALGHFFFPGARLEPSASLNRKSVIKIVLGADYQEHTLIMTHRAVQAE
ncbi:MAG: LytR C-terminal domain-containing protein [Thermodesulfobacteriota bacterium]